MCKRINSVDYNFVDKELIVDLEPGNHATACNDLINYVADTFGDKFILQNMLKVHGKDGFKEIVEDIINGPPA